MENQNTIHSKAISTNSAQAGTLLLAQQTLNLSTTADQPLVLKGGSKFIISNIIITNVSASASAADDPEIWTGENRTGLQIMFPNLVVTSPFFQAFTSPDLVVDRLLTTQFANYTGLNNTYTSVPSPVYFTLNVAEATPLTCELFIYGMILAS